MPAWISPGSTEARAARGNALREGLNAAVRRLPVWSVYALGILPGLIYLGLGLADRLGPDPVNVLVRALGLWALRFLVLGLAVTPLRDWTGISLLRHRRALGLLAFFYALAHLAAYAGLDQGLDWAAIGREILKRPYITIGMAAALLLLPLALTSTDRAIRRMGAIAWRRLHRLVYPAAALAAAHFVMLAKTWATEPLVYAGLVAALLAARAVRHTSREARSG